MSKTGVMLDNFIARYGRSGLQRFIDHLQGGRSGQEIAEDFGVSRERVRQWKNAFGNSIEIYQVGPDVQRELDRA